MSKLIIWDLDGTLVDSFPVTFDAFNDGIEMHLGRRLPHAEIMAHFGPSEDKVLAQIVGPKAAVRCYEKVCQSLVDRLHQISPFEGIVQTLEALKANGRKVAVFTGRGRFGTDSILKHLKWHSNFDYIVTNSEVQHSKPHPEGIQLICEKLGIASRESVMIGDSPLDIKAGNAAGALTIGCLWDVMANKTKLIDAKANFIASHPREILEFLA